jgi:SAM-dependent methyltransferase
MSTFADDYAGVYDSIYGDKDYAAECDYLAKAFSRHATRPVATVLDLGCGTGGHAIPLAQTGLTVAGVDRAPKMLDIARDKAKAAGVEGRTSFHEGDLVTFSEGGQFDAVICLFSVLSYQTEDAGMIAALKNMRRHLKPDGLLICDFWYGPAVQAHPPTDRFKIVTHGDREIIRLTHPTLDQARSVATIKFRFLILRNQALVSDTTEPHVIRYFFQPELEKFFAAADLSIIDRHPSFRPGEPLTSNDWTAMVVARPLS